MKKKRRFTKLEIVLISFVLLIIAGLFIFYSKSFNFNNMTFPNNILNTEKLPETSDGWGKYLFDKTYKSCKRTEPYILNPEFERALSLIFQRLHEKQNQRAEELKRNHEAGTIQNDVLTISDWNKNCLDIEYANSDDEMNGAEGLFFFSNEILVQIDLKFL